ncbi:MAG: MgtC/SapB family protein [Bryobacterales bacterium]|nr:MgtC/SapB family protein [Bryobacterales bacterium]
MNTTNLFAQFGVSLGLGLLVGLQRESRASKMAGLRTFPLVTLFGTLCAALSTSFGQWLPAAGLLALAALVGVAKFSESQGPDADPGLTTEIALMLMYAVGALSATGMYEPAIALGGGTAVLLHYKEPMHGIVAKLGADDLKALMQFVLITLVILPVLPDRTFGPYAVLNPRNIWIMVVLIVGLDFSAYLIHRFVGDRQTTLLGGVLGGLISSTAVAVASARQSKADPQAARVGALMILISSGTVYLRLLGIIAVLAPTVFWAFSYRFLLIAAILGVAVLRLWVQHDSTGPTPHRNPSELKPALFFGAVYSIALIAVAAGRQQFGDSGVFVVAGIAGLTDVDAIALSTLQLLNSAQLPASTGVSVVLLATLTNFVFKAVVVRWVGGAELLKRIAPGFGAALVAGTLMLFI